MHVFNLNAGRPVILASIIVVFGCLPICAQTNSIRYLTDDGSEGRLLLPSIENYEARRASLLELPLARSAEDDPAGNWGWPAEGMQLSFRLEKYSYEIGESITALVLLRNLSDEPVSWRGTKGAEEDYPFIILGEDGRLISRRRADPFAQDVSGRSIQVATNGQNAYWIKLDLAYNLTNSGRYRVTASRRVPHKDKAGGVELRSSEATLTLLPASDPTWTNRMSAELRQRMETAEAYQKMRAAVDAKCSSSATRPQPKQSQQKSSGHQADVLTSQSLRERSNQAATKASQPVSASAKPTVLFGVMLVCLCLLGAVFWRAHRRKSAKL